MQRWWCLCAVMSRPAARHLDGRSQLSTMVACLVATCPRPACLAARVGCAVSLWAALFCFGCFMFYHLISTTFEHFVPPSSSTGPFEMHLQFFFACCRITAALLHHAARATSPKHDETSCCCWWWFCGPTPSPLRRWQFGFDDVHGVQLVRCCTLCCVAGWQIGTGAHARSSGENSVTACAPPPPVSACTAPAHRPCCAQPPPARTVC